MSIEAVVCGPPSRMLRPSSGEPPVRLIGNSRGFRDMMKLLEQVAATEASVLLLGETGTGKGVAARVIHQRSARRNAPFVNVDCASLPATLIESELFGHERGAFTDARTAQPGRFEIADGGTIFLDEAGELSPGAQAKLLRILQYGEFERLGSPRTIRTDVRIIAATNRNLVEEVKAGRFRRDLFFRLNVFPISVPPLRERKADIPILAEHLLKGLCERHRRRFDRLPGTMLGALLAYDWPGNVRELENVLEQAVIISSDGDLRLREPLTCGLFDPPSTPPGTTLMEVERAYIIQVLQATSWRIEGPRGAARMLGLKPSTLRSRIRKLGIKRVMEDRVMEEPDASGTAFVA